MRVHEGRGKEAPCEGCYVELFSENEPIIEIYRLVRSQLLPSGKLDHAAVIATIELYHPDNVQYIFENMLICYAVEDELTEMPIEPREKGT